ncbi:MAG: arylsulfotransferase family protein, partial [Chloroflexota bacterium]|nr:arylsulfotransferase family protein [Chloroflexota bacterium]
EQITVTADLDLGPAIDGSLVFEVARPARQRRAPSDVVTDDPAVPPQTFRSRPDLRPPVMEITVPAEGTGDGLIFLGTRMRGGQAGATVIDDTGELVWFSPPNNYLNAHYDVRVQEYRGERVVTFAEANAEGPVGWRRGHYVICNTACERIAEFQIGNGLPGGDHHEFLLTTDGTALVGAYHPIRWDLSPYGGAQDGTAVDNVVQEIEIETGRVLFEWHSLDHIAIDESYSGVPEAADRQYDYLHMNSIAVAPDGDLIINARHTFAVYKLDRGTGDIVWRLNGKRSDFEMGDGTQFAYSHDAQLHERGKLTVFDNATSGPTTDVDSRGLVLRLDEEAMTATLASEYHHPDEIVSVSQANVQTLPNGNVFIGWGSAPVFSEFTSDGELIFNGRFPRGGSSYRAYRFPWVGIPAEPPAVAGGLDCDGPMTVYMSWNGATEVASWRVMGGESAIELTKVASSERKGFETAIEVETDAAYVAVEALDGTGAVIGSSEAVWTGG